MNLCEKCNLSEAECIHNGQELCPDCVEKMYYKQVNSLLMLENAKTIGVSIDICTNDTTLTKLHAIAEYELNGITFEAESYLPLSLFNKSHDVQEIADGLWMNRKGKYETPCGWIRDCALWSVDCKDCPANSKHGHEIMDYEEALEWWKEELEYIEDTKY